MKSRMPTTVYKTLAEFDPYSAGPLLSAHGAMMHGLIEDAGLFRSGVVGIADYESNILHMNALPRYVAEIVKQMLKWVKDNFKDYLMRTEASINGKI